MLAKLSEVKHSVLSDLSSLADHTVAIRHSLA